MPWDPDIYMTFGSERTRPAVELLARVPIAAPEHVIDLGCGPGNSTALLAARWPHASLEGLESSSEMLARARASEGRATWIESEVESWSPAHQYDVIFSNAQADERDAFVSAYRARLREAYPRRPDGTTLFPFRRLFAVARRSKEA